MNKHICCIIIIIIIMYYYLNSKGCQGQLLNPRCVNLFWTGGYDSTFRLLQIVMVENKCVNPIYLNFNNLDGYGYRRQNIKFELLTMKKIINELINLGYGSQIMPLKIIDSVTLSRDVIDSCRVLYDNGYLKRPVSQYAHMIQVSLDYNTIIEECAEKSDHSTSYNMLKNKLNDDKLLIIDKVIDTPLYVIRNMRFPIIDLTKKDMMHISKKYNFDHILKWTKSCWWPDAKGIPCRRCLMCRTRREELPSEFQESFDGLESPNYNETHIKKIKYDKNQISRIFNLSNPSFSPIGNLSEPIGGRFTTPMKTPQSDKLREIAYNELSEMYDIKNSFDMSPLSIDFLAEKNDFSLPKIETTKTLTRIAYNEPYAKESYITNDYNDTLSNRSVFDPSNPNFVPINNYLSEPIEGRFTTPMKNDQSIKLQKIAYDDESYDSML